jgi:hypothetical protein
MVVYIYFFLNRDLGLIFPLRAEYFSNIMSAIFRRINNGEETPGHPYGSESGGGQVS